MAECTLFCDVVRSNQWARVVGEEDGMVVDQDCQSRGPRGHAIPQTCRRSCKLYNRKMGSLTRCMNIMLLSLQHLLYVICLYVLTKSNDYNGSQFCCYWLFENEKGFFAGSCLTIVYFHLNNFHTQAPAIECLITDISFDFEMYQFCWYILKNWNIEYYYCYRFWQII